MILKLLLAFLFLLIFGVIQTIILYRRKTTPLKEWKARMEALAESRTVQGFLAKKALSLKKLGADFFLSDGITVSRWYRYKAFIALALSAIAWFLGKAFHSDASMLIGILGSILGWFFPDLLLHAENKSSNDAMMADIMEMSRSVLYGKRGGQYIADALRDAVLVVENKRLKTSLIRLRNDLDSGKSIDESLTELEMHFSNGEIASFCTVIRSLQSTGQVDEALKALEANVAREQTSVNKRRCVLLENRTMMYLLLIAFDILAVILYCIIMKLLEMQIAF